MASEDLAAALEAVAKETPESPAGDRTAEVTTPGESSSAGEVKHKTSKPGAEARIQELVAAQKTASDELEEVKSKLTERDTELHKLVELLEVRERDSQIVNKINQLHGDPKYTEMIERLDKAVQGVDEALEEDQNKSADGKSASSEDNQELKRMREELSNTRNEMAEKLADQQADMLLNQADKVIDGFLDEFPDTEYTDEDIKVISTVLDDQIDWEAIEENPGNMSEIIRQGVQEVKEWYGEPRGKLAQSSTKTSEAAQAEGPSLEDLVEKDWGKTKEVKSEDGKIRAVPVVSDADFAKVLGETLKRTRA